mgnify:CR=1 FL=1
MRIKLTIGERPDSVSEEASPAIVVAIEIADPVLADRLASLLGGVAGIRLAGPGEAAAVALVSRDARAAVEPVDIELTPRERDVLALMAEGASNKSDCEAARNIRFTPPNSMSARCSKSSTPPAAPTRVAHAARRGVIHLVTPRARRRGAVADPWHIILKVAGSARGERSGTASTGAPDV